MSEKTLSQYSVVFDDCCDVWTKNKCANLMFINRIEAYCNDILRSRRWLFLRDVYEWLGLPITKESCIVGWIYEDNNRFGDNFVKFDIREDGDNPNIAIDFNVDGDITDRL